MPREQYPREVHPERTSKARQLMTPSQRSSIERQETELDNLQPLSGWNAKIPIWLLCVIGIATGISNCHLFTAAIPGWFGIVIAIAAMTLETLALWCIINSRRTSSEHRLVLRKWGHRLGAFSLAHAVVGIIHFSKYIENSPLLTAYTSVAAFPAIIVLVWLACDEVIGKDWVTRLYHAVIEGRIDALIKLSESRAEREGLLVKAEVQQVKHDVFELRTEMKRLLVPILQSRAESEKRIEQSLATLPPEIQDRVRKELEDAVGKD
jgi:hypothetical protein